MASVSSPVSTVMPVAARAAVGAALAGGNRRGWLPGCGRLLLSRALAGLALVAAGYRWGDPPPHDPVTPTGQ